jgi:RNA polymerase sigma-70 factor (ECF subfamily)
MFTATATDFAGPRNASFGWPELLSHRAYLVRFAQRRLHDPSLAEDVVHDVFEAVLHGQAVFAGHSALRSWLTGVLKHKIVDMVRQRARLCSLEQRSDGDADVMDIECPQPRPDEVAEQRERLRLALQRIDALPGTLRDAVRLRLLHEQPTAQVCQALQISEENLFVRLHRARKQLSC